MNPTHSLKSGKSTLPPKFSDSSFKCPKTPSQPWSSKGLPKNVQIGNQRTSPPLSAHSVTSQGTTQTTRSNLANSDQVNSDTPASNPAIHATRKTIHKIIQAASLLYTALEGCKPKKVTPFKQPLVISFFTFKQIFMISNYLFSKESDCLTIKKQGSPYIICPERNSEKTLLWMKANPQGFGSTDGTLPQLITLSEYAWDLFLKKQAEVSASQDYEKLDKDSKGGNSRTVDSLLGKTKGTAEEIRRKKDEAERLKNALTDKTTFSKYFYCPAGGGYFYNQDYSDQFIASIKKNRVQPKNENTPVFHIKKERWIPLLTEMAKRLNEEILPPIETLTNHYCSLSEKQKEMCQAIMKGIYSAFVVPNKSKNVLRILSSLKLTEVLKKIQSVEKIKEMSKEGDFWSSRIVMREVLGMVHELSDSKSQFNFEVNDWKDEDLIALADPSF